MPNPDLLQPGDTLGKYEIVRELATGGMATIYLARVRGTAGFEKNVVLKCILPNLAHDQAFVSMFLAEARLAATLRHSNIADVFDVGNEGSRYFFAMEYVHGQNARGVRLEARDRDLPIPLEVSLAIAVGTASALDYAHDRAGPDGPLNLVHRDISPSNVLVSYEGAIKLVDFGIARASLGSSVRTRTGMRKGKIPYLSPEQCRGSSIDRRSDLFSLGTVLYELTTGQRPFRGSSDFVVMDQIVTGQPEPPSELVSGYPPRLEQIVMRLLAREPEARYQTAAELLDDMETLRAGLSMRLSANVVAKYMTELFALETEKFDRPTERFERAAIEPPESSPRDDPFNAPTHLTREYPNRKVPTGVMATLSKVDEEPTEKLRVEQLLTRRRSRRPSTDLGEEVFGEPTRQDPVLPFDPIDARGQEIIAQLDEDAPRREAPEARAQRRILALVDLAIAALETGELDKAVIAVELAFNEDTHEGATGELLARHADTIIAVYEAMLEDPYRTLVLTRPVRELSGIALEPRTRLLLPWLDGTATVAHILESAEMDRLEVYHHLCQLLLRGIAR